MVLKVICLIYSDTL